jgi:hypothetical protein
LISALDGEVAVVKILDLSLDLIDPIRRKYHLRHLGQTYQGIGCDELGFEVGKRTDAVVFLLAPVGALAGPARRRSLYLLTTGFRNGMVGGLVDFREEQECRGI